MILLATILTLCAASSVGSSLGHRIIGGSIGYAGQFPFLAAIDYHRNDGSYFCGGTLLSQQWVLTAAHCAQDAILFTVYLGSHNLDPNDTNLVLSSTDTYVIHPEYNPLTLENDIALIELRMPIEYSVYIQPAVLPTIPIAASLVYMTMGWGQVSDSDANRQERINWVYVTPVTNEVCRVTYGGQILDSMVCAEGRYNEGTCYGDTGGPLVHHESRVTTMVDGISSFISQNGCESTDPSGYTRVFPYNDWIRSVTGIV